MATKKTKATKKPTQPTSREKDLADENARLRQMVESQSQHTRAVADQVAAILPRTHVTRSELLVGVRNVSDNTLGIRSPFAGESDLHLHGDYGQPDPGRVAVISYAWWQQLRRSPFVANGQLVRDDSVLGEGAVAAPPDRDEDLPASAKLNVVYDPHQWIETRNEMEIRGDIDKMTSDESLRRLRRAVDEKIRALESQYPVDDDQRAVKALRALPSLYQLVDSLTTIALEKPEVWEV